MGRNGLAESGARREKKWGEVEIRILGNFELEIVKELASLSAGMYTAVRLMPRMCHMRAKREIWDERKL